MKFSAFVNYELNFNKKHSNIFNGALNICFHKKVHSGGHLISHFTDKQVASVKIALSPEVSFDIRLLSNMNKILMRVFENLPGGTEHLFSYTQVVTTFPILLTDR